MKHKPHKTKLKHGAARGMGQLRRYVHGRIHDMQRMTDAAFDISERVLSTGKYKPSEMVSDAASMTELGVSILLHSFKVPRHSLVDLEGDEPKQPKTKASTGDEERSG